MRWDDDDRAGDDTAGEDPALEDAFPLGDGTADVEGTVWCPYCGEANEVSLDPGSGSVQTYDEDCQVCCRPWRVTVRYRADGSAEVQAQPADGDES